MRNEDLFSPLDIDEEVYVTDSSTSILIDSITEQFDNAFDERKRDYVQSFITKYNIQKDQLFDDELEDLNNDRDRFFKAVIDLFYNKLNIGFPEIEDTSDDDQNEIILLTYNFFIRKIKRNFKNIILNYISSHEAEITNKYEKKKDVTFLHFKNEIDDEFDVLVLCNLSGIIEDALFYARNIDDVNLFFDLCEGDSELMELTFVREGYESFNITGNFIESYISMFDDKTHEIHSKVRNTILKKYPNRTSSASKSKESLDTDISSEESNDDIVSDENNNEK